MQGWYLEHQALKALGGLERISMVTPFRPRDPSISDELVLTGSRTISNWSKVYHGFTEYRLELLEERIRFFSKPTREISEGLKPVPFKPEGYVYILRYLLSQPGAARREETGNRQRKWTEMMEWP